MQTIQEIVNNKVQSMVDDGSIQTAIETGVQQAIEQVIKKQFESYGNFTKQLAAAVEEGLQINTKDLPFETYNQQMLAAVKGKLGSMFKGLAAERFMAEIEKTLAPAPAEMSINELIETIVKFWRESEFGRLNIRDFALVEINSSGWKGKSVHLWKNHKENSMCRPDVDLYISEDGKIRINHTHNYNPTCFEEHEAFIFKLYAAGTVITGIEDFDPDNCALNLSEDYD